MAALATVSTSPFTGDGTIDLTVGCFAGKTPNPSTCEAAKLATTTTATVNIFIVTTQPQQRTTILSVSVSVSERTPDGRRSKEQSMNKNNSFVRKHGSSLMSSC
jgi:hypothetical protein